MGLVITAPNQSKIKEAIYRLPISKSQVARRLMLTPINELEYYQEVFTGNWLPDDIEVLYQALLDLKDNAYDICVGESGTAMRFMLARIATTTNVPTRLWGEGRQHQRPIAPLVDILRKLGASIEYLGEDGYPPLLILPAEVRAKKIRLESSISSQYASALMLATPYLKGDRLSIDTSALGQNSYYYLEMTKLVLLEYGYTATSENGVYHISIPQKRQAQIPIRFEADWSSASYAYLLVSMMPEGSSLYLDGLDPKSIQGDRIQTIKGFEQYLGVRTTNCQGDTLIQKFNTPPQHQPDKPIDFQLYPDLLPTFVAAFLAQDYHFTFTGVRNLRYKESDRLEALRRECLSLGFILEIEEDSIVYRGERVQREVRPIDPHGDHRIAMALVPLATYLYGSIRVLSPKVVRKSFPNYWKELENLGYYIEVD